MIESPPGLAELAARIAACRACPLGSQRTQAVPGDGSAHARVMFLGEAPGFNEDQQGRPFVGQAGKLLDDLLALAGMRREDVFVANVLKCRPPGNRDPLPGEIEACSGHLAAQIESIDPEAIVTLGRFSLQRFLPGSSISRVHGQKFSKDGRIVVPMYHPAAALHQGNLRAVIEEDFRRLPGHLLPPEREPEPAPAPIALRPVEQGRLF
ncbi:MAG: uracil-DNA glycosylase [Dehalococcoidia bacterium]